MQHPPMCQKYWEELSRIVETLDLDSPQREAFKRLIQMGKAHTLIYDSFNEFLNPDDRATTVRVSADHGEIKTHLNAIDEWIFHILSQVVPSSTLQDVLGKILRK